ncbi:MAG: nickel pincer cofactor biosynthesis protein LarC [Nitrospirota bacterium]
MRIAYFDCFSGISGDMILGALVDAGLPLKSLKDGLASLRLQGYKIDASKVKRKGTSGTKVNVRIDTPQPPRRLKDIEDIINKSDLNDTVKEQSISVFRRLAEAEARVHGASINNVHFHEIGALDAIIDIVGSIIGFGILGAEKIHVSPVNIGKGLVKTEHGLLPVPAPATAELLKGIPVFSTDTDFELTTPTGAAIISTLSEGFLPLPLIKIEKIGYGAGSKEIEGHPNLLRVFIGEFSEGYEDDEVVVIETNIDDLNPQVYDYLMERLFNEGALDVFLTPIIMKKGRPAQMLSVIMERQAMQKVIDLIFKETTTTGVRLSVTPRRKLSRYINEVETPFGKAGVKISGKDGKIFNISPEYEDCRRIAMEKGIPLKDVIHEVAESARRSALSKRKRGK